MNELPAFLSYLLSSAGATVLIVWPETGPSASLRDRILRPLLRNYAAAVLDCYICCGFWCGLFCSPIWWMLYKRPWCWTACLITPYLFWLNADKGR